MRFCDALMMSQAPGPACELFSNLYRPKAGHAEASGTGASLIDPWVLEQ